MIERKEVLFANGQFAILLPQKSYLPGHVLLVPRQHYVILEQVPHDEFSPLLIHANTVSSLLFEKLNAHGTNILVRNGVPAGQTVSHVAIDIIPRWKDDNIELQWQPKQLSDDIFKKTFEQLKNEVEFAQSKATEKKVEVQKTEPPLVVEEKKDSPSEPVQDAIEQPEQHDEQRKTEPKRPAADYSPLKDARLQALRRRP
jgi:histidine triad (HIT) family protein